jgi:predicted DNA-binding transcriptional regulator AlpA
MPQPRLISGIRMVESEFEYAQDRSKVEPLSSLERLRNDPLLTADDVAQLLNVSKDWVWDHSSRKSPLLPVIRMGDGTLRYRSSTIEEFVNERERLSALRRRRR